MNHVTVYAIDRVPTNDVIRTQCSSYVKEDPAYAWNQSHFHRIVPPNSLSAKPYLTWNLIPAWISYIQDNGFTLTSDVTKLKPHNDIYIEG